MQGGRAFVGIVSPSLFECVNSPDLKRIGVDRDITEKIRARTFSFISPSFHASRSVRCLTNVYALIMSSTSSKVGLPSAHDLIHTTFWTDQLPMPSSDWPYQLATRRPLSAIPMAPPCDIARSGASEKSPLQPPTTPHPTTSWILCRLGSCGTKEPGGSTSQLLTSRDSPDNLTIFRL